MANPQEPHDFSATSSRSFTPIYAQSMKSESSFSVISAGSTLDGFSNDSPPSGSLEDESSPSPSPTTSLPAPSLKSLNPETINFRGSPNYRHHTWARTFHSRPEFLIAPHTIEEVQQTVLLARRCRRRLTTVGSGHSPSDLTCTSSWMVTLKHLNAIHSVTKYKLSPAETPSVLLHSDRHAGRVTFQAGISLHDLNLALATHALTLPNLGSIDVQSFAGAIATGTHGSSLRHGLLSESVRGLRMVLADGRAEWCTSTQNGDLFRAALVSLGALGIITDVEMEVAAAANIEWEQRLEPLDKIIKTWNQDLWTQAEFVRVWWMPYGRSAVVWKADRTFKALRKPQSSWYGGLVGFHAYRTMLWCAHWLPPLLPWIEWFVMGMQYGFTPGKGVTNGAVEEQRTGLLMDCLYSQFVNEWAIPLEKGQEALSRLDKWLNGVAGSGIPFSTRGLYIHAPIEVRVTDSREVSAEAETEKEKEDVESPTRAYLDPTPSSSRTLYLNATLYRPFGLDPPCRRRYYEAFEWLMRDLGGRPHWAKNFATVTGEELRGMYGSELQKWLDVRDEVDPEGLFVGPWHRRLVLGGDDEDEGRAVALASSRNRGVAGQGGRERELVEERGGQLKREWIGKEKVPESSPELTGTARSSDKPLPLEERQVRTRSKWWEGGMEWEGMQAVPGGAGVEPGDLGIEMVEEESGDVDADDADSILETLRKKVGMVEGRRAACEGRRAA